MIMIVGGGRKEGRKEGRMREGSKGEDRNSNAY